MSVALVDYRRGPDGEFRPAGVWLATRRALQGRYLPGDAGLEAFRRRTLADSSPPVVDVVHSLRGDWEDWARWAETALTNGHDRIVRVVEPEPTLELLYRREVLGRSDPRPERPPVEVTLEVPDGLGGWKAQP